MKFIHWPRAERYKNTPMFSRRFARVKLSLLCVTALLCTGVAAVETNILGLSVAPLVPVAAPQAPNPASNPAQSASAPKKAASSAKGKTPDKAAPAALPGADMIKDADAKSVLNGGVTMASEYADTRATVMVTTNAVFATPELRKAALLAAQYVQRDVVLSCQRQCKPAAMGAAKILPDNKLQFPMVVDGLGRVLSNDDMITMLLGKPLAVPPKPVSPASNAAPNPATNAVPITTLARPLKTTSISSTASATSSNNTSNSASGSASAQTPTKP